VGDLYLLANRFFAQQVPLLVVDLRVFSAAFSLSQKCFIKSSFEYAECRVSEKSFAQYFTLNGSELFVTAFTPLVALKPDCND